MIFKNFDPVVPLKKTKEMGLSFVLVLTEEQEQELAMKIVEELQGHERIGGKVESWDFKNVADDILYLLTEKNGEH